MTVKLPPGKVPWKIIADLVSGSLPPSVRLGPAAGEDAALVEIGGELWAVASDPISFTAEDAGRLAVIVNANDVAVRGATPRYFLAVGLIAPSEASKSRIHDLLRQITDTCSEIGAVLIGGHTEVTPGLSHSVVVGTMLGRVEGRPLTSGGLRFGDLVGMTRFAGLEGTAILRSEYGDSLPVSSGNPIDEGWLLVAPEALRSAACPGVSALHDVTEGGVGEALYEMAKASKVSIEVVREDIPVLPDTAAICADFGIDPLGLIGSGSLLLGCRESGAIEVENVFAEMEIPLTWIGRVQDTADSANAIPRFPRDELLKAGVMKGVEAVIFDMDGTLVDSTYDWPAIRRQLEVTGPSIIDQLNGLPEPDRTRKWTELEAIEESATAGARLHEGSLELLRFFTDRSFPCALVTNNNDTNTQRLLDRFGLKFDEVLTRDCGLWKPSGAPIAEAARRLGVPAEICLGVGDSHYNIMAAREAGLQAVCMLHDGAERHNGDADLSFSDIPAFLRYLRIVLC